MLIDKENIKNLFVKKEYKKILKIVDENLHTDKNNIFLLNVKGMVHAAKKEYKDSINCFEKCIAIDGTKDSLYSNLAFSYIGLNDNDRGIENLILSIKINDKSLKCLITVSELLIKKNDFESAQIYLKKALKLDKNNTNTITLLASLNNNWGVVHYQEKRFIEAELSFRKAIELKPDFFESYLGLSILLAATGRFEEAELTGGRAIELNPDYPEGHSNLGYIFQSLLRFEEAEISCRKAIDLKYDLAEAHSNLGLSLQRLGRLDEAEMALMKAIELKPNLDSPYLALSQVFLQLRRFEKSYDYHVKYLELKSIETHSNSNLGNVISKFAKKMQEQNGIPTFFDNAVESHLTGGKDAVYDFCEIFERGQYSKENRFLSLSDRIKNIPPSLYGGRLFDGIPFIASQGIHSLIKWKENFLYKTSFDLILYWMIIQEVKPDVIIELGSGSGGSAVWLADIAGALGLETHVYSFDINKPSLNHDKVTFMEYDLNEINSHSKPPCWENFVGKKIIIEDAHVNLEKVLNLFDTILKQGDYLIVEDSGEKKTIIKDFVTKKDDKYRLDQFYLDFFGTNITCSQNSIFKIFT
jgi:tetratricopeptide (TPR) repeat protein/cephalosporin hydroxylase